MFCANKNVYLVLGLYSVGSRPLGGVLGKPSFEGGVAPDNTEEGALSQHSLREGKPLTPNPHLLSVSHAEERLSV